ncbi:MAG TPA: flavodoxin family protein [Thermodesulfovibrionales bacterium]|nr:flavodoxin family protein [Thermodesulfovibrionales bacterium]
MKTLILNGALRGGTVLDRAEEILVENLGSAGWTPEVYTLREVAVGLCTGCFGCWIRTPGTCVINDAGRDIARKAIQSDLLVFLTPVTFGGYSSELKKAVDRFIPIVSPFFARVHGEVHHKPRYKRYPRLLGIGEALHNDDESEGIFQTLVRRNGINFYSPAQEAAIVRPDQEIREIKEMVGELLVKVGVAV